MFELLLWLALIALSAFLVKLTYEREKLMKELDRFKNIRSPEQYIKELNSTINLKQRDINSKRTQFEQLLEEQNQLTAQIRSLRQKLNEVEEEEYIQNFGFYKSKYDFANSQEYKNKLETIRERQQIMLKNNAAAICHVNWTVEDSLEKGKKSTKNFLALVLRAFNGECDSAIAKVKYNNANSLKKRIIKSFSIINKLSKEKYCEITQEYLNLKLDELDLTHGFQEQKKREDDEQRRIREKMREEKRAHDELEKARKVAEQEVKLREQDLEKARREDAQESRIHQLTQQLEEARLNAQQANSRVQMSKSGNIYIISNIGSFGENIYKIGVTRRFEPLDRVKELGGSSVPFPFDVHAIIYSENALEMEMLLHQYFWGKSVNKVNERKEFFRVTLDEIELAAKEIAQKTRAVKESEIRFTKVAEAEQYRKTQAIERSGTFQLDDGYSAAWDDDEDLDDE